MYLGLFHGRDSPREAMNSWGFDGPALGPLKHVHITYQQPAFNPANAWPNPCCHEASG
jgi:hypothetical protein